MIDFNMIKQSESEKDGGNFLIEKLRSKFVHIQLSV